MSEEELAELPERVSESFDKARDIFNAHLEAEGCDPEDKF
jgi:hypothetical protein